jgi:hypothetical protein
MKKLSGAHFRYHLVQQMALNVGAVGTEAYGLVASEPGPLTSSLTILAGKERK